MLTSTHHLSGTKSSTVAIIHDALVVPAGSERVALYISDLFPDAPIYTSAYLPENTFSAFKSKKIHTLPFSKLVKTEKLFKILYPLWLIEISRLDLSKFDVVISSANYLAKFIRPPSVTFTIRFGFYGSHTSIPKIVYHLDQLAFLD